MTPTVETVFGDALALPVQSRAQLADMLWESLPEEQLDLGVEDDVRLAWAGEAQRRMQDAEIGKVALLPGEEVMDRFRSRLQE
jgi:putative addiction module component (TIGR02574 family)